MIEPVTYTMFAKDTGSAVGYVTCSPDQLDTNLRALVRAHGREIVAKEARHHLYASHLDADSEEVIAWKPEQPDEFHEWDEKEGLWKLTAERLQQLERDRAARAEIDQLETKERRYVAEKLLGIIDEEGERRFRAIRTRIAELRSDILKVADPAVPADLLAEEPESPSARHAG